MELRVQAVTHEGKGRGRSETMIQALQKLDQPTELTVKSFPRLVKIVRLCRWPCSVTNVDWAIRAWPQVRQVSIAEADYEEADNFGPSDDHSPCNWAFCHCLMRNLRGTFLCLPHHFWLWFLSYILASFRSFLRSVVKVFTKASDLRFTSWAALEKEFLLQKFWLISWDWMLWVWLGIRNSLPAPGVVSHNYTNRQESKEWGDSLKVHRGTVTKLKAEGSRKLMSSTLLWARILMHLEPF